MLLSAAGPALLSCAFALLQRADSVAVVDPVLKEECHRIETWCAQFVRNLAGGPSREEVDQLLSDVRADAPRSCQALLRHEVHTLVCTLQALRSTRGDRPRGGARAPTPRRPTSVLNTQDGGKWALRWQPLTIRVIRPRWPAIQAEASTNSDSQCCAQLHPDEKMTCKRLSSAVASASCAWSGA